jgi:hypothetical protein
MSSELSLVVELLLILCCFVSSDIDSFALIGEKAGAGTMLTTSVGGSKLSGTAGVVFIDGCGAGKTRVVPHM